MLCDYGAPPPRFQCNFKGSFNYSQRCSLWPQVEASGSDCQPVHSAVAPRDDAHMGHEHAGIEWM
jgi:hypothetical protein